MLKVGLTGGIGSGKSVVSKIFSILGIPVFHADEVSKNIINQDRMVMEKVAGAFGKDLYRNGILDRRKLSGIVFADTDSLKTLNAILHPAVSHAFSKWVIEFAGSPYIIKEAAILFESGTDKDLDIIVSVAASESLRIQRVMDRDGVTDKDVRLRMNNQLSEEERISRSDEVIRNDVNDLIIPQVLGLHKKFQGMSGHS